MKLLHLIITGGKMKSIQDFFTAVLILIIYYLYLGWVINDLWTWFMVPLGVVKINIAWAIGLVFLFKSMKGIIIIPEDINSKLMGKDMVISPIILWSLGWFIFNYYI